MRVCLTTATPTEATWLPARRVRTAAARARARAVAARRRAHGIERVAPGHAAPRMPMPANRGRQAPAVLTTTAQPHRWANRPSRSGWRASAPSDAPRSKEASCSKDWSRKGSSWSRARGSSLEARPRWCARRSSPAWTAPGDEPPIPGRGWKHSSKNACSARFGRLVLPIGRTWLHLAHGWTGLPRSFARGRPLAPPGPGARRRPHPSAVAARQKPRRKHPDQRHQRASPRAADPPPGRPSLATRRRERPRRQPSARAGPPSALSTRSYGFSAVCGRICACTWAPRRAG